MLMPHAGKGVQMKTDSRCGGTSQNIAARKLNQGSTNNSPARLFVLVRALPAPAIATNGRFCLQERKGQI
jgi:hypothetical protein